MTSPLDLVDAFVAARWISDRSSPLVEQAPLADFITEGHLARHIRHMRELYMELESAFMSRPWRARYSKQTAALAEPASALMELLRVLMTFAGPGWATGR